MADSSKYELGGWAIGEALFNWIKTNLPAGSKILEFGSGQGSAALSETYNVTSVEHDERWLNAYEGINYVWAPIVDGWYDTSLFDELSNDYDLILVDGPPGTIGRSKILDYFGRLNPDAIVIFDDTDRDDEQILASSFASLYRGGIQGKKLWDSEKAFTVFDRRGVEKKITWNTSEMIYTWIKSNLDPGSTILEFGASENSLVLAEDYTVCSVEHDLQKVGVWKKINYVYSPIIDGWYADTLFSHIPENYQLIIVDGPGERFGNKSEILNHFDRLDPSVAIIFYDCSEDLVKEFGLKYRGGDQGTMIRDKGREFTLFGASKHIESEPKVCLNMIVRDEETNLPRLLESVKDWISYYVICDTGSTDGTIEMIKEFGEKNGIPGEIYEHEWQNFGHNRTLALTAVYDGYEEGRHDCDWCLTIDADEKFHVEDPDWISKLDRDRSYCIDKVERSIRYNVNQLINISHERWDWRGPAHNYSHRISGDKPIGYTAGAWIIRDSASLGGKSRKFKGDMRKKYLHDAELFEKELEKNPKDARSQFYLAQSYRDGKEPELAYDHYVKRAEMTNGWYQESYISWLEAGRIAEELDRKPEAIQAYMKGYNLIPRRPECPYYLSTLVKSMGLTEMAYIISKSALERLSSDPRDLFLDFQMVKWRLKDRHSINAFWKGEWIEAYTLGTELVQVLDQIPEDHRERVENNLRLAKEEAINRGLLDIDLNSDES